MHIKNTYAVLIIGGGISACVFLSNFLKDNFRGRIALVEAGRSFGGRSSTRFSKRFKDLKINHGSPNLNISNSKNNNLLDHFIEELLESKLIEHDDSDAFKLTTDSCSEIIYNGEFSCGANYRSTSSMSELSKNIISLNASNSNIDYFLRL